MTTQQDFRSCRELAAVILRQADPLLKRDLLENEGSALVAMPDPWWAEIASMAGVEVPDEEGRARVNALLQLALELDKPSEWETARTSYNEVHDEIYGGKVRP